jgi:glucose-6-phosphate 1-dehydrogenase
LHGSKVSTYVSHARFPIFRLIDVAIYMRTNIKTPGFASKPTPIILGMDYKTQFDSLQSSAPDAYTRLLLNVLRGRQGSFVRNDELERSWAIFTPLLHALERDNVRPKLYKEGVTGPTERVAFLKRMGASIDDDSLDDSVPMHLQERSLVPLSSL